MGCLCVPCRGAEARVVLNMEFHLGRAPGRGLMISTKCPHEPPCPLADAPDCEAAHVVAAHPEQGWSLLCNGVVLFEDTGDLLPDGRVVAPHRDAEAILAPYHDAEVLR
jgi:hypothetical protein